MKEEVLYHLTFGWGKILEVVDSDKIKVKFFKNDKVVILSLCESLSFTSPQIFFENHEIYKKIFCDVNKIANTRYFGEFLWKETITKAVNERERLIRLQSYSFSAPQQSKASYNKVSPPSLTPVPTPSYKKCRPEPDSFLSFFDFAPSHFPEVDIPFDFTPSHFPEVDIPFDFTPSSPSPADIAPFESYNDTTDTLSPKDRLLSIWESFGFEGFLHTTEFQNFKEIITDGKLICREQLDLKGHSYTDRANSDIIDQTDRFTKLHCRFYYRFKTPTNYAAYYKRPIILVFTPNMLRWSNIKYSYRNAASTYRKIVETAEEALEFNWNIVFEDAPYYESKLADPQESKLVQNSEFLVKTSVSTRYINKIYFKYSNDMEAAKCFCSPEIISKFCLDRSKFF